VLPPPDHPNRCHREVSRRNGASTRAIQASFAPPAWRTRPREQRGEFFIERASKCFDEARLAHIDVDHRKERAPALGAAVEHGDAQVGQMGPRRDLGGPNTRGYEFWSDNYAVPAVPIADQFGERRKRTRTFTGTERGDGKR
jgi:hypothetical protein